MLESVFKANPDCENKLKELFEKMGEFGGKVNPLVTNSIMDLFNRIASQSTGGFFFNESQASAQSLAEASGASGKIAGGGGASWITPNSRGANRFVTVFEYNTPFVGNSQANHAMNWMFIKLVHEIAHVAGLNNTYGHSPGILDRNGVEVFNEFNQASQALGASDLNSYVRQHCLPIR